MSGDVRALVFRVPANQRGRYAGMWVVDCYDCNRSNRNTVTGGDYHCHISPDWADALAVAQEHVTAHRLLTPMHYLNPTPHLIGKKVRTVVEGTLLNYDHDLGQYTLRTDPAKHVPWEMQFHWATEFEPIDQFSGSRT